LGLFGTARPCQCSEDAKTDEHSATETPTDAANNAAAQRWRGSTRSQSVGAVGYRGDCHEERTKRHALKHRRRIGTQELRQKRSKENRGLGIEESNDETVPEDALKGRSSGNGGRILSRGRTEHLHAEVHKVERAGILDYGESNGRNREQSGKTNGSGKRVAKVAEGDTGNRHQPKTAPLNKAARNDVEHARPRRDSEDKARKKECGEQRPRWKEISHCCNLE